MTAVGGQLQQVMRMIKGSRNLLFSTHSQTFHWQDPLVTFGEPLARMRTLCLSQMCGVVLLVVVVVCLVCVWRGMQCVWCGTLNLPVCTFEPPPYAQATRPHVLYMWALCRYTRRVF